MTKETNNLVLCAVRRASRPMLAVEIQIVANELGADAGWPPGRLYHSAQKVDAILKKLEKDELVMRRGEQKHRGADRALWVAIKPDPEAPIPEPPTDEPRIDHPTAQLSAAQIRCAFDVLNEMTLLAIQQRDELLAFANRQTKQFEAVSLRCRRQLDAYGFPREE